MFFVLIKGIFIWMWLKHFVPVVLQMNLFSNSLNVCTKCAPLESLQDITNTNALLSSTRWPHYCTFHQSLCYSARSLSSCESHMHFIFHVVIRFDWYWLIHYMINVAFQCLWKATVNLLFANISSTITAISPTLISLVLLNKSGADPLWQMTKCIRLLQKQAH